MNLPNLSRMIFISVVILLVTACGMDRSDPQDNNVNRANQLNDRGVQPFNNMDPNRNGTTTHPHHNSRMEMSQEIAEQIANMEEVDSANVLVTDQNVYVAVMLENNQAHLNQSGTDGEVPVALKNKIARTVKSLHGEVQNVYVSANPDFVDRINGYVDQIQDGRPVQGLINEFNTLVQRVFPTNSGTNSNNSSMMK